MTRKLRPWPEMSQPRMLTVTGVRDQTMRITYLPWADAPLGLLGWELVPDIGQNLLVYLCPTIDRDTYEIRCHVTTKEPDPENDRVVGTINLPDDLFGDREQ